MSEQIPTDDAVVVRIGASRYAVGVGAVAEVGRVPPVTRLPGVPSWLAGVVNWRGRILPVVDLRPMTSADADLADDAPSPGRARLVVLSVESTDVGLLVDAVDGMAPLGGRVDPLPLSVPPTLVGLLAGEVSAGGEPLALLDVGAVLRLRDTLPRQRRPV